MALLFVLTTSVSYVYLSVQNIVRDIIVLEGEAGAILQRVHDENVRERVEHREAIFGDSLSPRAKVQFVSMLAVDSMIAYLLHINPEKIRGSISATLELRMEPSVTILGQLIMAKCLNLSSLNAYLALKTYIRDRRNDMIWALSGLVAEAMGYLVLTGILIFPLGGAITVSAARVHLHWIVNRDGSAYLDGPGFIKFWEWISPANSEKCHMASVMTAFVLITYGNIMINWINDTPQAIPPDAFRVNNQSDKFLVDFDHVHRLHPTAHLIWKKLAAIMTGISIVTGVQFFRKPESQGIFRYNTEVACLAALVITTEFTMMSWMQNRRFGVFVDHRLRLEDV